MLKKVIYTLLGIWLVTWVGLAAFGPERNPELRYSGALFSEKVDPWLKRSCYDCHSNRTEWPWYAEFPPANLLLAFDVAQGRGNLNFSTWGEMSEPDRADAAEEVIEMLNDGKMPPDRYLWLHSDAGFSAEELEQLKEAAHRRYGLNQEEMQGGHSHSDSAH